MDTKDFFDLTGKVALITGSTKGIGRAIAEAMAKFGAKVVISSRDRDRCDEVATAIRAAGGEALAVPCNVYHKERLAGLVKTVSEAWGQIDILVCNAAANTYFGSLLKLPDDAYERITGTNLRSVLWLCQMAMPGMMQRGDGVVLMISSVSGVQGDDKVGIYGASKAAEIQLARNLAVEGGPRNVRVNCIVPGLVKTDFARALWDDPVIRARTEAAAPLGRIAEPEDIAGAAVFLASRAGGYVTGQALVVDGGMTIRSPV